jgi:2'-5' RNA ligase
MGFECDGGPGRSFDGERLNVFALVIYIPPPLGQFLDELRRELVPHYNPHAHVSVLPPRPLGVDWQVASDQARSLIEGQAPFEVELTNVEVFPHTDVIYVEIGAGAAELTGLHSAMNYRALQFHEPFAYHPHITLAQEVPHGRVEALTEQARRRRAEYRGPRTFRADRAVFVQNTSGNCWVDLAEYSIGAVLVR